MFNDEAGGCISALPIPDFENIYECIFFLGRGGTRVIKCLFILDWLLFQALRSAKCRGFFRGGFWEGGNEMNQA